MKTWRISAVLCLAVFLTPSRLSAQPATARNAAPLAQIVPLTGDARGRREGH